MADGMSGSHSNAAPEACMHKLNAKTHGVLLMHYHALAVTYLKAVYEKHAHTH
jgi:hypothetical protein